jgi:hypothetical protein
MWQRQCVDHSSRAASYLRRRRSLFHPRRCTGSEPIRSGAFDTVSAARASVGVRRRYTPGSFTAPSFRSGAASARNSVCSIYCCIFGKVRLSQNVVAHLGACLHPTGDRSAAERSGTSPSCAPSRSRSDAKHRSALQAGWCATLREKSHLKNSGKNRGNRGMYVGARCKGQ